MDSTGSSKIPGLPRYTRLPQHPGSRATGSFDEGPGMMAAPSGIPGLQKRSSIAIPQRPGSSMKSYADIPAPRNRTSSLVKPGFQTAGPNDNQEGGTNKVASPTSPGSPLSTLSSDSTVVTEETSSLPSVGGVRKSRPSLSDRTLETLSKVPPSPSPAKRRQSGFFTAESPMRPPSRTGSSLGYSRPGSRASTSIPGLRPSSPTKGLPGSSRIQAPVTPGARRSISSTAIKTGPAANRQSLQYPAGTSRMQPPSPSTKSSGLGLPGSKITNGTKIMAKKPIGLKSSTKDMFGGPLAKPSTQPRTLAKPLKAGQPRSIGTPSQPRGLKKPLSVKADVKTETQNEPQTEEAVPASPLEERKISNSSQNLRATIAAARAARKSAGTSGQDAFTPRSIADETFPSIGPDSDPNSLDLMDSTHINIVKKRINNARKDGKLNIAALCLSDIPSEVLKMYEYDPDDKSSSPWYENVDVTKLVAADNEFKELPSEVFPSSEKTPSEGEPPDGIFAGIVDMDLHGNMLQSLPPTLGNLPVLTALNLSRNQLGCEAFEIIGNIKSLKELRLAENKLTGTLPDSIGQLEELLTLDIQSNSVNEIPSSIGRLSKLSKLNVAGNRLSSLPFEALFDLQLTEIVASRNQLKGYLISSNVPSIASLKVLDVSMNALFGITDGAIELPQLQILEVANNRMSELPNVTTWVNLVTLNVEENKLSAFPEGFTTLTSLKNADFGNNSLLTIDDDIGLMDTLTTFNIKNNPIKERRLPRLGTEELKAELRNRKPDLISPSSPSKSQTLTSSPSAWPVNHGTLDRSNTRLQSIDRSDIEALSDQGVHTLVLHHNTLPKVSPAIELLGSTLTSLDLSNNKLGKTDMYLEESISLPNLQTLNLTSNGLISLDPLVNRLAAPRLTALIVAFNRIKTLPKVCQAFPELSRLIAANNKISILDVDSVRGLQVLDLSSNEIEHLPPKLAVLQGQLRTLVVTGNKFRVPGYAMLQKGTEEVLSWLRTRIPAGEEGALGDGE